MGLIVERSKALLEEKGPLAFGFYTSGQLFLEEYYTLGVIGKAGLGTPNMDGNTRLCTAMSGAALKESFGTDGQPGSYADIDHADAICLWGHNVAETQTVLWMRMLDRLEGPNPPKLIVADPRPTVPAKRADVHLAVKNGTNMALMDGILREVIENGHLDRDFIPSAPVENGFGGRCPLRPSVTAGRRRRGPWEVRATARWERGSKMFLANYLGMMHQSELELAEGFRKTGGGHADDPDVYHTCNTLAKQCEAHAEKLKPFADRYGEAWEEEPERLFHDFFDETREGSFGLLRDLRPVHDGELLRHHLDHARPGRPGVTRQRVSAAPESSGRVILGLR